MKTVNIHYAKTHFVPLDQPSDQQRRIHHRQGRQADRQDRPVERPAAGKAKRLGFMAAHLRVPANFDRVGEEEIETLFGGHLLPHFRPRGPL